MSSDSQLSGLTRKRDRAGDLELLYEVFDRCHAATVSTVIDDEPWSVPMLVVRDGARLMLHGSTGAGALGHIARGAKVSVAAFILDGLVIAERQFDHSANYRSAVVRGTCRVLDRSELPAALDKFTDGVVAGRAAECPPHSAKELAQTLLLELPITAGMWVAKKRAGPPATGEHGWTGFVPIRSAYDQPISTSDGSIPASVRNLSRRHP